MTGWSLRRSVGRRRALQVLALLLGETVKGATLLGWNMGSLTNSGYGPSPYTPCVLAEGLGSQGLCRGIGVGTGGVGLVRGWGGSGWTNQDGEGAVRDGRYALFSLSVTGSRSLGVHSLRFDYRRSTTGPTSGLLQVRVDPAPFGDVTNLVYTSTSGASIGPILLDRCPGLSNLASGATVDFRLVNCGGGSSGTWYIYDRTGGAGCELEVQGEFAACGTNLQGTVLCVE